LYVFGKNTCGDGVMNMEKRVGFLYGAVVLVLSLMTARLYNLSNPQNNESLTVLDGQYTGRIEICERSGFVYDRNEKLLSHDKCGKIILINPAVCADAKLYSERIASVAKVSTESDIYNRIHDGIPFTVVSDKETVSDEINGLDGVYVFDLYSENNSIAKHLLGYNNIDGDGVSGIRQEYDGFIGQHLYSKVYATFDTNAKSMSMSPIELYCGKYNSKDGVVTTLDKDLQMFCDGMEDRISAGGIVVADIQSGDILAMTSMPGYDNNNMGDVLASDKGELVNRCLQSFTPGSVFKIVVAASALEYDSLLWDMEYECSGTIEAGGSVFRCHKHSGHGIQTMSDAFANSCNTYFINLGMTIGLENIVNTAKKLGLHVPANADFLWETNNFFINEDSQKPQYLAQVSFGQGDLCLSLLDMTGIVCAVTSGYMTPLSVIDKEIRNGEYVYKDQYEKTRIFKENTCEKMLIMMEKCVSEGTARGTVADSVKAGGKTATAQTGRFNKEGVELVHKWFCGVYPLGNPKYSICILMDYSTESDLSPAVVFSDICLYLDEKSE